MLNLCRHKEDFGVDATWVFFATSHAKSPCDGIGGTVKRITARASLQRPYSDQILDVSSMLDFCKTNIPAIEFIYISKERMGDVRLDLKERFALGQTIPGIRSYHFFKPVSSLMSFHINVQQKMMHLVVYSILPESQISMECEQSPCVLTIMSHADTMISGGLVLLRRLTEWNET